MVERHRVVVRGRHKKTTNPAICSIRFQVVNDLDVGASSAILIHEISQVLSFAGMEYEHNQGE